jgi:CRP-like cAMP-binding protein
VRPGPIDARRLRHTVRAENDPARWLRRSPLFRNVGMRAVRDALRAAAARRVGLDGFYFRQGERPARAYVLVRGAVKLVRSGHRARGAIVRVVVPLEPFGLECAFGGTHHVVSAQALLPSAALTWPASALTRLMATHRGIASNSLHLMALHVQGACEQFHGALTDSLERRTATALLALGAKIGCIVEESAAVELRLPRRDLAAVVGTTPSAVGRIIRRWRRLRIVDAGRSWIIMRPHRLAAMVTATSRAK